MFSVLLVCCEKDSETYLLKALESMSVQTLQADEIIIVLNGYVSKEILSVIDVFRHELKITTKQLESNEGLAEALNIGLSMCQHEFIARMDPDDISYPNRFCSQYRALLSRDVDVICGSADIISYSGELLGERILSSDLNLNDLISSSQIIHPAVIFKKSTVLSVGGYDKKLMKSQDWDLWIKILKHNGKIVCTSEKLFAFRLTESTIDKRRMEQVFNRVILRRHFGFGPKLLLSYARSYAIQYMPRKILKILLKFVRGLQYE